MDLHQLDNPVFLALLGLILANAAIGATAIPQLVDRYIQNPTDPEARALTIARARRLQTVTVALLVLLACAAVYSNQPLFQFGLGAYAIFDTFLAVRTRLQTARGKKNGLH